MTLLTAGRLLANEPKEDTVRSTWWQALGLCEKERGSQLRQARGDGAPAREAEENRYQPLSNYLAVAA